MPEQDTAAKIRERMKAWSDSPDGRKAFQDGLRKANEEIAGRREAARPDPEQMRRPYTI